MEKIKHVDIRTDISYDTDGGFWIDISGDIARIGMSPLVQETSGSFVAVRMSNIGSVMHKGESFGSVEAEKHVGQLHMPLSGKIVAVNEKVIENPRLLNTDPYGKGWLVELELDADGAKEAAGLLSGDENVKRWFREEIDRYEKKGWLAES